MATEMGEYIVGAYLKLKWECDVVDYNARPPGGGLKGLGELDVIGFSFGKRIAYLCEVTTHLDGLLIRSAAATIKKLAEKYERQRDYAEEYLGGFEHRFMFWSPVVRRGLVSELEKIGFELFINGKYKDAVDDLRARAQKSTADTNNPAFRGAADPGTSETNVTANQRHPGRMCQASLCSRTAFHTMAVTG